jgi:hypothetical protein
MGTGGRSVYLGVNRPVHEANHSLASTLEAKNGGSVSPLPIRLHDVILNNRDKFYVSNLTERAHVEDQKVEARILKFIELINHCN